MALYLVLDMFSQVPKILNTVGHRLIYGSFNYCADLYEQKSSEEPKMLRIFELLSKIRQGTGVPEKVQIKTKQGHLI